MATPCTDTRNHELRFMAELPTVRYGEIKSKRKWKHNNYKGKCDLCSEETPEKYAVVDYDHLSGIVRGLTCETCNSLLLKVEMASKVILEEAKEDDWSNAYLQVALIEYSRFRSTAPETLNEYLQRGVGTSLSHPKITFSKSDEGWVVSIQRSKPQQSKK
jgi:hypothetical protein